MEMITKIGDRTPGLIPKNSKTRGSYYIYPQAPPLQVPQVPTPGAEEFQEPQADE
jgi:hypothetical protein